MTRLPKRLHRQDPARPKRTLCGIKIARSTILANQDSTLDGSHCRRCMSAYAACEAEIARAQDPAPPPQKTAAEVALKGAYRQLAMVQQELLDANRLAHRLAQLLTQTADALKGPPPPHVLHDWADLPGLATAVVAQARRSLPGHRYDAFLRQWRQTWTR